ncbi:hypothetical protein TI05_01325 [Achromatium sp. WMS3]|nr:hypothetical protein TI05_01325 [Achromatium sp. WMS3]
MNSSAIRVLLIDDSSLVLDLLTRILSAPGTGIEVVGTAQDGVDALSKIPKLNPQVICTDLKMPRMDGLELTRTVMARYPRPILILSVAVEKGYNDDNIFQLLEAGAIDVMPKPQGTSSGNLSGIGKELITKIKLLAGVVTFTRHRPATTKDKTHLPQNASNTDLVTLPTTTKVIAIGASTGGPQALHTILSAISPKLSIPILCMQHISAGFTNELVTWLNNICPLPVKIAKIGESLLPGIVYFPPDNSHLILNSIGHCTTNVGAINPIHRPSITLGFNSIAQYYGRSAVGILLTGMGADGADGLLNIRKAYGLTIAEDEKSCVVFGMPKVAAEIGAAQHVLSLSQIAKLLAS